VTEESPPVKEVPPVPLEAPRFGEFARQVAAIRSSDVVACLSAQRAQGGRLGQIMVERGLLSTEQVTEVLRNQAHWVARMRSHDIAPQRFPLGGMSLSLCLPCFNEAQVIGDILAGAVAILPEFLRSFEVVVVDDGSTDATSTIVECYARRDDRIRLLRHGRNRGYGAAVATGLRAAQGDWICFTDGDGQFRLLDLPQLLVNIQSCDVAIGYRYRRADNFLRRFNAFGWKSLIRYLIGLRVRDLDCAFKLFPRWVVERLELTAEGACISAQMLAQCIRGGLAVSEVPVSHFPRAAGKATGANFGVVLKAFRELSVVRKYRHMPPWPLDGLQPEVATSAAPVFTNGDGAPVLTGSETANDYDTELPPFRSPGRIR
jgi:hypothetical protein